ncbi:MAG: hypothetical protein ACKVXR_14330 [Planctomycetota bacterium]
MIAWIGLAAIPLVARADILAFAPAPDTTVTKSFTLRHQLVMRTMKVAETGVVRTTEPGLEVNSEVTLEVVDTYRGVQDGRPLSVKRFFQVAGLNVELGMASATGEKRKETWLGDSPIRQSSVAFVWIPEERTYGRHYDELENLEEYLAGLREDTDLRGLLPAPSQAGIAVGSRWTIDVAAFEDVFGAGGDVPRLYVQGGGGFLSRPIAWGVAGPLAPVFGGELAGEAHAHWRETREEAGARLAVIDVRARLEAKRDLTQTARASRRTQELLDETTIARASIEWRFEGEGTLLWNLGAGRFESLKLQGREVVLNDVSFGSESETMSRQTISLDGKIALEATAKAKPR